MLVDTALAKSADSLPAWVVLLLGCALLTGVVLDRHHIRAAWRRPARFWKSDEYGDSRTPAQPLNLVLAVVLGTAAVVYGLLSIIG